jgi:hypothetical protein
MIDMKFGRNKPTQEQEWWLDQMAKNDRQTNVCYFCREVASVMCEHCLIVPEKVGLHG